jgi:hypothetical protein
MKNWELFSNYPTEESEVKLKPRKYSRPAGFDILRRAAQNRNFSCTWSPGCLIIKGIHMETVFDHEPTAEELRYLFLANLSREEYLANHQDQETEYGNIYALYMIRGNREKALEYLNRIRNPKQRFGGKSPDSP